MVGLGTAKEFLKINNKFLNEQNIKMTKDKNMRPNLIYFSYSCTGLPAKNAIDDFCPEIKKNGVIEFRCVRSY